MTAQKWVRSSLRTLSVKLEAAGHAVSVPALARLLRKLDYSLHVNSKKIEASSNRPDGEAAARLHRGAAGHLHRGGLADPERRHQEGVPIATEQVSVAKQ
jgi:hypothetical protein